MSQAEAITREISENPIVATEQETQIARTLICNYENFLIALIVFENIPQATIEEKTEYAKMWKGQIDTLRSSIIVTEFPPAYDPVWLECLQAIGSTTIVSP